MTTTSGRLILVSTPIGNLGDLSTRSISTLAESDLICCEDTRRTRELLTHAGIRGRRLLSLHAHNEASRVEQVLGSLRDGQTVSLVTDAGTPLVSDPGARLVTAAIEAGYDITAVPGPNAALMALVVSGLAVDRFCFEGFLPRRGAERKRILEEIALERRTVVIYEAPGRLAGTLADLLSACGGERQVAIARELTKLHEEVWRGDLAESAKVYADRAVQGEVVVVLAGAGPSPEPRDEEVTEVLRRKLALGDTARDAAAETAKELTISRRRAYEIAVSLNRETEKRGADHG